MPETYVVIVSDEDYSRRGLDKLPTRPDGFGFMLYFTLGLKLDNNHVTWLHDSVGQSDDLDASKVRDAMEALRGRVDGNDTVIFVYSGHGYSDGSLCLNNGRIYPEVLATWMDAVGPGQAFAILDSCYSGKFAQSLDMLLTTPFVGLAASQPNEFSWGWWVDKARTIPGGSFFGQALLKSLDACKSPQDAMAAAQADVGSRVFHGKLFGLLDWDYKQHPTLINSDGLSLTQSWSPICQILGEVCCQKGEPPIDIKVTHVVHPIDPNDKIGPAGTGPNRVVSTDNFMEYMVRFENMTAATAPVQELIVVDYLDPNLDWTTVEFEEIAYGDRLIQPPAGSPSFTLRDVPTTNSSAFTGSDLTNMAVNVSGTFNPQVGRIEWRVTCVDTNTGTWPIDVFAGILPPEDGTGRGQGHVRFRVKPKTTTPIGTVITNAATIVFDNNEPISTALVWNMVGDVPSLATTIAYPADPTLTGKPFTYSLAITNTGSSAATNVVVTNTLPDGFNVVSNYVTIGRVTQTNGILTWIIDSLTNGVDARWFITVLPINAGTFTNNISYSGGSGLAIFTSPGVITVLPSVPSLGIRINGGQVELYWQTNFTGFHVQRTSSLSTSNRWVDVTNAPVIVGQEYRVTNGPPVGTQFYRLSGTLASSVAQPVIGIQVVGTEIQLSWPTNANAFHLQSAASIAPAAWSDVTNVPAALGGFYRVNVNATGASSYFRLLKP